MNLARKYIIGGTACTGKEDGRVGGSGTPHHPEQPKHCVILRFEPRFNGFSRRLIISGEIDC